MRKLVLLFTVILVVLAMTAQAGVEWQAKINTQEKNKTSITTMKGYAQGGNVREEFIEAPKGNNPTQKKGMYWLYRSDSEKIYIVNPEEKSYMELTLSTLGQFTGFAAQVVQMTITNPKVELADMGSGQMLSYNCRNIQVKTSYDMETKLAFIKSKNHIEQTQELWGTESVGAADLGKVFKMKSFSTGKEELDDLIRKQMATQKDLGFILKSVMTTITTDQKGKAQTTATDMTVTGVEAKDLSPALFQIPAGYEKAEMGIPSR